MHHKLNCGMNKGKLINGNLCIFMFSLLEDICVNVCAYGVLVVYMCIDAHLGPAKTSWNDKMSNLAVPQI